MLKGVPSTSICRSIGGVAGGAGGGAGGDNGDDAGVVAVTAGAAGLALFAASQRLHQVDSQKIEQSQPRLLSPMTQICIL